MSATRPLAMLVVAVLLAACGGETSDDTTAPTGAPSPGDTTQPPPDATPGTDPAAGTTVPDATTSTTDAVDTARVEAACAELVTVEEATTVFGEAATFDPDLSDENDGLGQLICSWSTLEDPDDPDDLTIQGITIQLYSGDPVPGENFYDPSLFDESVEVDGIGEAAYVAGTEGAFLDGDRAGFVSYLTFEIGADDPEESSAEDTVLELLRQVHQRSG